VGCFLHCSRCSCGVLHYIRSFLRATSMRIKSAWRGSDNALCRKWVLPACYSSPTVIWFRAQMFIEEVLFHSSILWFNFFLLALLYGAALPVYAGLELTILSGLESCNSTPDQHRVQVSGQCSFTLLSFQYSHPSRAISNHTCPSSKSLFLSDTRPHLPSHLDILVSLMNSTFPVFA
jgi:hypothetical protein